jgi:transposase-like protein
MMGNIFAMSEDIKKVGFLNEKLPCPYCGEKQSNRISLNGSYEIKDPFGGDGTRVPRFLCRNCGQGYTKNTNVVRSWNYGYEERSKRLTMKTNPITKWSERNVGPTFKKLKSHQNQKTEDELFKRIDDLIIEQGFLEVAKVKERLRIGTTTYYRYMKKLRNRLFWNGNTRTARAKAILKEVVLLELKTKAQIHERKRPQILRVFVLCDKESKIAYDYFLVGKKKFFRRVYFFNEQVDKFGHFYITPELIKHLGLLREQHPNLIIELDCEVATTKRLSKMAPHLFCKAKNTKRFWSGLERYKMRRKLSFAWTMVVDYEKRKKIRDERQKLKGLTKKMEDEKAKTKKKQTAKKEIKPPHPVLALNSHLNMLLSIYNQHHISRLNRN